MTPLGHPLIAVVQVATCPVPHIRQHLPVRNAVATQAVGDEASRLVLQADEQALEEALRGSRVTAALDEDVEQDTVLVHRAPEIMQLTTNLQEHLIEVPGVARLRSALTKLAGKVGAELAASLSDALLSDADAPLGQDQLHLAQAQAEDVIQSDGVFQSRGWKAVAGVGHRLGRHAAILARHPRQSQERQAGSAPRELPV